jgi:hypothetical protein
MIKLFVYYVGGKAPNANIEVHDVMFAFGESFEDGFVTIKENWFGLTDGLHVDCYAEINYVDGYQIKISERCTRLDDDLKLFFVNLGAYQSNQLAETHFYNFVIADNIRSAKQIAKQNLSSEQGLNFIHADRIAEIDNILEISSVVDNTYSILLFKSQLIGNIKYNHGYFLI